jgi:phage virion morphogenesis protein
VEFTGRVSPIARIHQYGLRDQPSPKAREIQYPKRELLGFSSEDREGMLVMLLEHLEV